MNTAEPIRKSAQLERFKRFYLEEDYHPRNHLLVIMGLNTALRISDMLSLTWQDVYHFEMHGFHSHLALTEQKTGKQTRIFMNRSLVEALQNFLDAEGGAEKIEREAFLFQGRHGAPLSRTQAWRIIKKTAEICGIEGIISPHSLRKTFGYTAWKKGMAPAVLMNIFNHSSYEITKRYLGITQEDRDEVFRDNCV